MDGQNQENGAANPTLGAARDVRKVVSRMSLGMLLFILIQQLLGGVATVVEALAGGGEWVTSIVGMVVSYGIALPLLALYYKLAVPKDPTPPPPEKQRLGPGGYLLGLMAGFGVSFFLMYLTTYPLNWLSKALGFEAQNIVDQQTGQASVLVLLIFFCVQPGIFEELTSRFLPRTRMVGSGDLLYILYSALIFMASHMNFFQIYTFGMGVVMAYIYARTRNILYPMSLHFLNNLITLAADQLKPVLGFDLNDPLSYITMAGTAVLLIVKGKSIWKGLRPPTEPGWGKKAPPSPDRKPAQNGAKILLLNPGTIALLVMWVAFGLVLYLIPILTP